MLIVGSVVAFGVGSCSDCGNSRLGMEAALVTTSPSLGHLRSPHLVKIALKKHFLIFNLERTADRRKIRAESLRLAPPLNYRCLDRANILYLDIVDRGVLVSGNALVVVALGSLGGGS